MVTWNSLNRRIVRCDACPRLRQYCSQVGRQKRRAYADWSYWARPVPNFGHSPCDVLIVGLAPAAHGANRTGRMFTGDRSGDFLYRALFRAGFANRAAATDRHDGLELIDCAITAVCHCAPPQNKPTGEEIENCRPWLERTLDAAQPTVLVALGQYAWRATLDEARRRGWHEGRLAKFGHGCRVELAGGRWLLGSYHPSQQNTFTGRLTEAMFDTIFSTARSLLGRTEAGAKRP